MKKKNYVLYDQIQDDFWYVRSRNNLLNNILSKIYPRKPSKKVKILDLGCGTGFNYPTLAKYGEVHSADFNKDALETCRKKGITNLYEVDAHDLSIFEKESFDMVVCIELIEHLKDDRKAMDEISRILKKGGYFIGTTPAHMYLWSIDDKLAHHERRYSKKELRSKLSKNFKVSFLSYRYVFLFVPTVILFQFQKLFRVVSNKEKNSLTFTPSFFNNFLSWIMGVENKMLASKKNLPFGISFLFVTRKK